MIVTLALLVAGAVAARQIKVDAKSARYQRTIDEADALIARLDQRGKR